jgi:hypothetical protein
MKSLKWFLGRLGLSSLALALLSTAVILPKAQAGSLHFPRGWQNPSVGAPKSTRASGVRGACTGGILPIAFSPTSGLGKTMQDSFPMFFYIPQSVQDSITFSITDLATQKAIYSNTVELSQTPTLLRLEMGDLQNKIELKPQEFYQWKLQVDCQPTSEAPIPTIAGMIQRKPYDQTLANTLTAQPLSTRPLTLYQAGLQYDAIVALFHLMEQEPENSGISNLWQTLIPQISPQQMGIQGDVK